MKNAKRIFGGLLAALMLLAALPLTALAEDAAIELVDIGNVWRWLLPGQPAGFSGEVNPNEPGLTDQMELVEECWIDLVDGHVLSSLAEFDEPMLEGRDYVYAARLAAKDGFVFADGFRFVYGGTEYPLSEIEYEILDGGKELKVSGFEYATILRLGDVDGKDGVTAADALMALQAATGKIELDMAQTGRADVDGQEGVTAADALMILQFATDKIDRFPAEDLQPGPGEDDPWDVFWDLLGQCRGASYQDYFYTPACIAALEQLVVEAEEFNEACADDFDPQDVWAMNERMQNALDSLEYKNTPAELQALLDDFDRQIEMGLTGMYTDESVAALKAEMDAARPVAADANAAPEEVAARFAAIQEACDALEFKSEEEMAWQTFDEALEECRKAAAMQDVFTPESLAALQQAIDDAEAFKQAHGEDAEAEEIDAMTERLGEAQQGLVLQDSPAALQAVIDSMDEIMASGMMELFTDESVAALTAAVDTARAVAANPDATPAEVAAQKAALQAAFEALEIKPEIGMVDKSDLNDTIARAKALDPDAYVDFSGVTAKLTVAEAVAADDDATQAEVNDANMALADAITALVEKPEPVDKTDLNDTIARAKALDPDDYVDFSDVTAKLTAAEAVAANDGATQIEVNEANMALADAITALVEKPVPVDKTALQAQIARAKALDPDAYDDLTDVNAKLAAAETVLGNEEATQAEVNDATAALRAAIDALTGEGDEGIGSGDGTLDPFDD